MSLGKLVARAGLNGAAVLLIFLIVAIVAQVACSALDINPVMTFGEDVPLLGPALTLNSLLDIQWHLLVLLGLLPSGLVWLRDRHVRVDFLYETRSERWKAHIDIIGNLVFAVPFFALMISASWSFAFRAWTSDEFSRNGGLHDLWLIKMTLPAGLIILAAAILSETIRLIRVAR